MNRYFSCIFCAAMMFSCANNEKTQPPSTSMKNPVILVIHGGAGTITPASMTPDKELLYHQKLKEALDSGYVILQNGGKSMDCVVAVISILEDSPLFNAGKGSVFSASGKNEMDASVMDGKTLMAGAVAGVTTIKNPIKAAEAVMNRSEHVLLFGEGAEIFAKSQHLEIVDPAYFFDSTRYNQWKKVNTREQSFLSENNPDQKFGTVGCVALDADGNISAGTSTGGMTNKKFGRVGDSPIIGAGTYADNNTCAISCTGHGEYFIRLAIAHEISALMEHGKLTLGEAAEKVIMGKLTALGGTGGVIGITRTGEIVMTFNTEGMYRGYKREGEDAKTFIYKNGKD
jgi:L-asparaginase / beta-aspartyl-peptidase